MILSDISRASKIGFLVRDAEVSTLGKLNALSTEGTLVFLDDKSYINAALDRRVSAVIATHDIAEAILKERECGVLVSQNPKEDFYMLHEHLVANNYYADRFDSIISSSAHIADSAKISVNNVVINANSLIEDNVVIKAGTKIGENCIVRSGCILGNECFEVFSIKGRQKVILHGGNLIIGNYVEIQSNSTISKGLFPGRSTVIEDEVIIADLVHIAHGVQIGERTMIAAGATLSGNVSVGSDVWIGPGVIISNGLKIGSGSYITIGSVVISDLQENSKVSGNFAIDHSKFVKFIGRIR